nr:MAK10-like protein [Tanacetum cinerariifolium]
MEFAKLVNSISLPQNVPSTSDCCLIELENQVQRLMEAHLVTMQPTQVNKINSSCKICSGPYDTQYCLKNPEQAFVEYASSRIDEARGKWYTFKPEQNNLVTPTIHRGKVTQTLGGDNPKILKTIFQTHLTGSNLTTSLLKTEMGIRTEQIKEPKSTLEDEFQDLHLNLPVLEVLAHALIYNEMLYKYVESLELSKKDQHSSKDKYLQRWKTSGYSLYFVGIVKDVEVHIGKLKLLNDFYLIDLNKDPETPLLVRRGFLETTNAGIDCRKAKIVIGEGITRIGAQTPYYAMKDFLDCHLPEEWEIAINAEINPFKDVLVFRRMVEFLGAIPINLKSSMWELEDLINNLINWDKPPQNRDVAWHAKIRLINPDGEEFTKTLQSIPTTRTLFERESPKEIIDLYHFYDT